MRFIEPVKAIFCTSIVASSAFITSSAISTKNTISRRFGSARPLRMSNNKEIPTTVEGWKTILSPEQFQVLRRAATEPPGYSENTPGELEYELKSTTGSKYPKSGVYECVGCGAPLYTAKSKFDSGCGWPAFYEGVEGAIKEKPDPDGRRIEIVCNNCNSHLGHVFKGEGFPTPTNERHCVNGICLNYNPTNDE